MFKLELYLSKIIKYGLYAILLTPLAFWPKALFPFLTPKFILFQILVEIVFGAWFLLAVLNHDYRPKFNYLTKALLLFLSISLISAFFGVDFQRSFWGIGARLTGLFAEFHFFVWFLVLISYFKNNKEEWTKYLDFSFVVALIVALTSFYQNPKWSLTLGYGVFNNPTFVAPYLIFHFFWGLYKTIFNFQFSIFKLKEWFFVSGVALLLFVILFAQIRIGARGNVFAPTPDGGLEESHHEAVGQ